MCICLFRTETHIVCYCDGKIGKRIETQCTLSYQLTQVTSGKSYIGDHAVVRTWIRRSECCYNVRVKQRRDKESTLMTLG